MNSVLDLLTMGCPGGIRPTCESAAIPTIMINNQDAVTLQRWVRDGQRSPLLALSSGARP
jgi:hypothetical protein